jgi:hypothetical protein
MRRNVFVFLFCSLLVISPGCNRRETPNPVPRISGDSNHAQIDVCGLITSQEIEAIQGSPIKETKGSARSDAGLRVSQCFYTAAEFSKSVSLAVTQRDPDNPSGRSARVFWEERFGRYDNDDKKRGETGNKQERDRTSDEGEEKESVPPKKITGIGEEAYWAGNRMGGVLYVLKKDAFIRISLGGTDNEEARIVKSKALAQKALQRL